MKNLNEKKKKRKKEMASQPVHEDVAVQTKGFPAKETRFKEVGLGVMIMAPQGRRHDRSHSEKNAKMRSMQKTLDEEESE